MTDELKQEMAEKFNSAYGEEVKIGLREALCKVYIHGAEHGYQYAIDKACEWLDSYFEDGYDLCNDFRKAMEE